MTNKNTICLWYEGRALDAAPFSAATFPDSAVGTIMHAPGRSPSGEEPGPALEQKQLPAAGADHKCCAWPRSIACRSR